MTCNASIVLFHTPKDEIQHVETLLRESGAVSRVRLIDNGQPGKNIGYGAGHNIAIRESISEHATYHLVLNSDIDFQPKDLKRLIDYMEQHPDVALLQPKIVFPDGTLQASCKLLPTPWDVFARRFLPTSWISRHNRQYELIDSGYDKEMNIPYLSGCFMLLRVSALQEVGLFDERFFMYPEDIDLTRRLHAHQRTMFFPSVTIIHNHRKESYHSVRLLLIHVVNMIRYFNKWGWFYDSERRQFNQNVIKDYLPHA